MREKNMPDTTCPGAANLRGTPTLAIKKCPECGADVELFSTDLQQSCPKCSFVVYNDVQSCIRWCRKARECLGDELYEELSKQP
jgi:hypothetical protein